MKTPIYQLDAFATAQFTGNPAAVCPLSTWPDDTTLQAIAAENNVSETAFCSPVEGGYRIRWFSPVAEVDLCGHATLASAYVVFNYCEPGRDTVTFHSKSGPLHVVRKGDMLELDFPSRPPEPADDLIHLGDALGLMPAESYAADDILAVYHTEDEIRHLAPDFALVQKLPFRGVMVTAPGNDCDFVSRFFVPKLGIDEDPATGSAHCTLTPYWSPRLGKKQLHARQLSHRSGEFFCTDRGPRVGIAGRVIPYLVGTIDV